MKQGNITGIIQNRIQNFGNGQRMVNLRQVIRVNVKLKKRFNIHVKI